MYGESLEQDEEEVPEKSEMATPEWPHSLQVSHGITIHICENTGFLLMKAKFRENEYRKRQSANCCNDWMWFATF